MKMVSREVKNKSVSRTLDSFRSASSTGFLNLWDELVIYIWLLTLTFLLLGRNIQGRSPHLNEDKIHLFIIWNKTTVCVKTQMEIFIVKSNEILYKVFECLLRHDMLR